MASQEININEVYILNILVFTDCFNWRCSTEVNFLSDKVGTETLGRIPAEKQIPCHCWKEAVRTKIVLQNNPLEWKLYTFSILAVT